MSFREYNSTVQVRILNKFGHIKGVQLLRIRNLLHSRTFLLTILILALWVLSEGAAGWHYYAFRDDWFAMGRAATWGEGSRWLFYLSNRLDSYRPLSFLVITEVWSRFWPHITVVAAIIVFLLFWSVLLWRKVLSEIFSAPFWAFVLVVLWLPLTNEGQYWITAANGIVLGLWFLGWAGLFLVRYALQGQKIAWILATLAFLAADLCYEQYWFGVFVLTAALLWQVRSRWWPTVLASPALALVLTAVWYLSHTTGMKHNGKVSNHSLAGVVRSFHLIVPQISTIWGREMISAWTESWHWDHTPGIWMASVLVLAAALALLVFIVYTQPPDQAAHNPSAVPGVLALSGILWVAASYAPWLITHYDWVADRSVTVAAPGVGLIAEALLLWLSTRRSRAVMVITAAAVMTLSAISVNLRGQDIRAYVAANSFSANIGRTVNRALALHNAQNANLTVIDPSEDFAPWTYAYHDHISTVWDADWGVQDMLEDLAPNTHHDHVQVIWPGDFVTKANSSDNIGIVLTTHIPDQAMITRLGVRQGIVVQYRDTWPRPQIVESRWFSR